MKPSDVPRLRFLGRSNVVGGQGDLRKVRHEDQQQHRKGGDHELAGQHERDGHEGSLQDRPADLVDDPRQNALVDRPPLLNQRHDVRQPRFGQDDARGPLGNVGRGADGDADFGLAEGGRIVDAIARHAGYVPGGLQVLHHDVFVLRIHFGETIGTRQQVHRLVAGLSSLATFRSATRRMLGKSHSAARFHLRPPARHR